MISAASSVGWWNKFMSAKSKREISTRNYSERHTRNWIKRQLKDGGKMTMMIRNRRKNLNGYVTTCSSSPERRRIRKLRRWMTLFTTKMAKNYLIRISGKKHWRSIRTTMKTIFGRNLKRQKQVADAPVSGKSSKRTRISCLTWNM